MEEIWYFWIECVCSGVLANIAAYYDITAISWLMIGAAWLTTKHCKIFSIRVKYHSIKSMKWTYLFCFLVEYGYNNSLALIAHHISTFPSWKGTLLIKCQLTELHYQLFWEETCLCKSKPQFFRKESQTSVNFTVMNCLQNPVAEINPPSQVMWLQSMNYSQLVWPIDLLGSGSWSGSGEVSAAL
jgi:hypothetical protein